MDSRAEKLAKARRKLKDHQEKKSYKDHTADLNEKNVQDHNDQNNVNVGIYPQEFTVEPTTDHVQNVNSSVSLEARANLTSCDLSNSNVNEYFIYSQTSLENEVRVLQQKLSEYDVLYSNEKANHNKAKQNVSSLEWEISDLNSKISRLNHDSNRKDDLIIELSNSNQSLRNDYNNLIEQLELTKTILTSKESENSHLQNQVSLYFNQLEGAQLQLQQLSSDSAVNIASSRETDEVEQLNQKVDTLDKKIASLQQEKDNVVAHYKHYLSDLKEQLNAARAKNEHLMNDVDRLTDRENSLIEQISEMEIRMQKFNKKDFEVETQIDTSEFQKTIMSLQKDLEYNKKQYKELLEQYQSTVKKMKELEENRNEEIDQDTISVAKLTADITSDKIAAQKATEQNLKLKTDVQNLEQVVIKMTKDKLELTEMLTHEKNLSKELMLKMADIEDNSKNLHKNLMAKDEEMIRLQIECREFSKKYNDALEKQSVTSNTEEPLMESTNDKNDETDHKRDNNHYCALSTECNKSGDNCEVDAYSTACENKNGIPKEDAMCKLQQRFMRIMDEVANLSDEKHRLEHIILQLQIETDTICEYVALYQQQRSLLKKRDEDRIHQLKMFEKECNELRALLGELRELLFRLAEDKEISGYLKTESRLNDMARIRELLEELQNSSLLNKKFKTMDLSNFYPCSCCSGKLIDV